MSSQQQGLLAILDLIKSIDSPSRAVNKDKNELEAEIIANHLTDCISSGNVTEICTMNKSGAININNIARAIIATPKNDKILHWFASQSVELSKSLIVHAMLQGDRDKIKYMISGCSAQARETAFAMCRIIKSDILEWFIQTIPPVFCYDIPSSRQLCSTSSALQSEDEQLIEQFSGKFGWPADVSRELMYVRPDALKYCVEKVKKIMKKSSESQ